MKLPRYIFVLFFLPFSSTSYDYDIVVIGGGATGTLCALCASEKNKKVALIEKNKIGGGFMWHADLPYAYFLNDIKRYKQGKKCSFTKEIINNDQLNTFLFATEEMSIKAQKIFNPEYYIHKGMSIFYGCPYFINKNTIKINKKKITSHYFLIATGATPLIPDIKGIETIEYLTPETFFKLEKSPKSMIIIGDGALGVQMAHACSLIGIKVTLISKHKRLLIDFDSDTVKLLTKQLIKDGVNIQFDMHAKLASPHKVDKIKITCESNLLKTYEFAAEKLFIATNKKPNTQNIGLEKVGVKFNKKGIITNKTMQTSVSNIYACGDVIQFPVKSTQASHYQSHIAIHNITKSFWEEKRYRNMNTIVKCSYTFPEIASLGLTQEKAYKLHKNQIIVYQYPYSYIPLAIVTNETLGLVKLILQKDGVLIGVHIFGKNAARITSEFTLGQRLDTQLKRYNNCIYYGPGYFDFLWVVLEDFKRDFPNLK